MKKILITGVAGLIGSRMADWIIEHFPTYEVIGIDDLSGGYFENINSNVMFYNMDIVSDKLSGIFEKHEIDYVYHFAAYAAEGLSPFIRKYNYTNNLLATANIIFGLHGWPIAMEPPSLIPLPSTATATPLP